MTIDVPTRGDHLEGDPRPSKSVGRRTVLAGAAWTVPAVALAAAAPAHAASGLMLAFDKTSYSTVGCGTLEGVTVTVSAGTSPTRATTVTVSLPNGLTFASGQNSVSGSTDENGVFAVPAITVANAPGTVSIAATAGTLTATAMVRVAANSSAAQAIEATPGNPLWPNTPPGSVNVGANYFLSASGELWWENRRVASGVVAAVGWNYNGGEQYVDYRLSDNTVHRANWENSNYTYGALPLDARPIGQAYFLTEAGVLYHYATRVTGNVKSVVTWADGTHHADIELDSGVLIRATRESIEKTYSPLPDSARPIGADFFLSDDGDLFFRSDFVAAQVTSAVGWSYQGNSLFADYMTESGEALRAWEKNPRDQVYTGTPAGARALGTEYYLTNDGRLYWSGQFAIDGVDKAIAWSAGYQMTADVRTTSGACIRLWDKYINSQWSPMPETALPIGANYFYESAAQELYYQGNLLVTGVTSAGAHHIRGQGDYCEYRLLGTDVAFQAAGTNVRNQQFTGVPAGAAAIGREYFLAGDVLLWRAQVIAHGVVAAKTYTNNGRYSVDFQLGSGVSAQALDGDITKTFSPMPASAVSVGADYFLTTDGELFFQGNLVATHVLSATGWFFLGWGQTCNYVTSEGAGCVAFQSRQREREYKVNGVKFVKALTILYYEAEGGALYYAQTKVNQPFSKITTWLTSATRADIITPGGQVQSLWDSGVTDTFAGFPPTVDPATLTLAGSQFFLAPDRTLWSGRDSVLYPVATGVVEARGWVDSNGGIQRVDYRRDDNTWWQANQTGSNVTQILGVAKEATPLGSGYFLTPDKELWFKGSKVASGLVFADAWSRDGEYYCTYETGDGIPRRAKGATPDEKTWIAGELPLHATLVGSKYALAANKLWFEGASVADGVSDAAGWSLQNDGQYYADFFSGTEVKRINGATNETITYGSVPTTAQLLGYGYQLSGTDLLFRGATVAQDVTSGFAWVDGGPNPYCDYRTENLSAYRIRRPDAEIVAWLPDRHTPVGSEPRGADYFVSADGVLSFQGQLADAGVVDVVGWNWGGDRYADYRIPGTKFTRRVQAKGLDTSAFVYASPAVGTVPIGAGYWLNEKTGQLWYANAIIVDDVEVSDLVGSDVLMARGWVWGNPAVNYREKDGAARRREKNVNPAVTTFLQGSTPLGSKPVGADYFLNDDELWWQAGQPNGGPVGPVTSGVARAIGYWSSSLDVDFVNSDGVASTAQDGVVVGLDDPDTPAEAIPVGARYFHVPNGKLYYNGKALTDSQRNELGNIASAVGWSNGQRRASYALIKDCSTPS